MVLGLIILLIATNLVTAVLTGLFTLHMERKNQPPQSTIQRRWLLEDSVSYIRAVTNPMDPMVHLPSELRGQGEQLVNRYTKEVEGK
jgi:hypothetical protein